jgi:hypothetical protein
VTTDHRTTLAAIAQTMAARGDAQVLTRESANDPDKCPAFSPDEAHRLRMAYDSTHLNFHGIAFADAVADASILRALRKIAEHQACR